MCCSPYRDAVSTEHRTVRYWYSEKQARLAGYNWVTLPIGGEMKEVRYSECFSGEFLNGQSNWDDAVYLGENEYYDTVRLGPKPYYMEAL